MSYMEFLKPEQMAPDIDVPPVAERRPLSKRYHGRELVDPYAWLRDPEYPEVREQEIIDYLRKENDYFNAAMEPHREQLQELFLELKGRIKSEDASVPVKDGEWEFWWRYRHGEEYREHFRRLLGTEEEELLLSEPELARGEEYFRLGGMDVSPDGRWIAFSVDTDGSERYTMRFRSTRGDIAEEELPETIGDPLWLPDNRTILYLELSEEWRPYRLRSHTLGEDPSDDPVYYEERDISFFLDVDVTQSREYLVLSTGDHVTTEIRVAGTNALLRHIQDLRDGTPRENPFTLMLERREEEEHELDHWKGFFYLRTNDRHKNFRLVRFPLDARDREEWEEIVPPSDHVYLRGLTCFSSFYVLEERLDGVDQVRIRSYDGEEHRVAFPEEAYTAGLHENPEYDVTTLRLHYQSMVTPPTRYEYHLTERRLELLKVMEIPSGYDRSRYTTERLTITARDGTRVPASIVYPHGLPRDGSRPLFLYGYGAYGMGISPHFSTNALSLLERGFSDPRVTYWEPAKWVAKLRATKTDRNVLLLKTNMGAGHGGRSGRYAALEEEAEAILFMLLAVGEGRLPGRDA